MNEHLTAIARKFPSAPLRYLIGKGLVSGYSVLDYGCGRGIDVECLSDLGYNARGWDPYWAPDDKPLSLQYDTVLCTYVLNVLPPAKRKEALAAITDRLQPNGIAFVTVRTDIAKTTKTAKGTAQYSVHLKLPVVKRTSTYCIYKYTKGESNG
jgi:DNA phosphorothioation-associated putative methyltransferase